MIQSLIKRFAVVAVLVLLSSLAFAQGDREKQLQRVEDAGDIMQEIMEAPDKGIPEEIIASAKCIAVVPSLVKAGFVFGGEYGHGIVSCRTEKGWSSPAFFGIKGGTFGLQIGGQAIDLVMLIMNDRGMRCLLSSKFELGADASVAAGPVGRHAEGATDWKMIAQVLTYSRSRGAFAGITVKGAVIDQDDNDTRIFYGKLIPYRTLLTDGIVPPKDAHPFLAALDKYAPMRRAEKKAEAAR